MWLQEQAQHNLKPDIFKIDAGFSIEESRVKADLKSMQISVVRRRIGLTLFLVGAGAVISSPALQNPQDGLGGSLCTAP